MQESKKKSTDDDFNLVTEVGTLRKQIVAHHDATCSAIFYLMDRAYPKTQPSISSLSSLLPSTASSSSSSSSSPPSYDDALLISEDDAKRSPFGVDLLRTHKRARTFVDDDRQKQLDEKRLNQQHRRQLLSNKIKGPGNTPNSIASI